MRIEKAGSLNVMVLNQVYWIAGLQLPPPYDCDYGILCCCKVIISLRIVPAANVPLT